MPDPCIASAVRVFLSARLLVMDDIFQLIWKVVDDFFGVVVSKPRGSQFWLQYHGCPMSVPRSLLLWAAVPSSHVAKGLDPQTCFAQ